MAVSKQDRMIEYLRGVIAEKNSTIARLEENIFNVKDAARRSIYIAKQEHQTDSSADQYEIKCLRIEIAGLKEQITAYKIVEKENKTLRESLAEMKEIQQRIEMEYEEKLDDVRQQFLSYQVKLKEEFRRTLRVAEGETKQQLQEILERDAHDALRERPELNSQLTRQHENMEFLSSRYNTLESLYTKMKTEFGLTQKNYDEETRRSVKLKQQLREAHTEIATLQMTLRTERKNASQAEQFKRDIVSLQEQLEAMNEQYHLMKGQRDDAVRQLRDAQKRVHTLQSQHYQLETELDRQLQIRASQDEKQQQQQYSTAPSSPASSERQRGPATSDEWKAEAALRVWNSRYTDTSALFSQPPSRLLERQGDPLSDSKRMLTSRSGSTPRTQRSLPVPNPIEGMAILGTRPSTSQSHRSASSGKQKQKRYFP